MTADFAERAAMTVGLSLPTSLVEQLVATLDKSVHVVQSPRPLHVVYGGAHLFSAGSADKIGARARTAMETWGANDEAFGRTIGVEDPTLASEVAARVRQKLERQPVEAICIDFEDGYGPRSDETEDADALRAAKELAAMPANGVLVGIRIKPFGGGTTRRAVRTLDLFVTALAGATAGVMRPRFSVTLPKVTDRAQVEALASTLERLEALAGLKAPIAIELMIESPRALIADGSVAIPGLVAAGGDRVVAVHLGAYDLTAELGVSASDQRLDHPLCDLARMVMQLSLAGTSVGVCDGATTLLPIAPKGASAEDSAEGVHRAWALHAANVSRAIAGGIWQGWDLHPAQLPARYGAVFAHLRSRRTELATRLRVFLERAAQASRVGQIFDDAATAQALVAFFQRGLACGALDEADLRVAGLEPTEIGRPFADVARRRAEIAP